MKSKKPEVKITHYKFGNGYFIQIGPDFVGVTCCWAVTQDELEEIVMQSLPYLRVPKGTKRVELKK